MGNKTGKKETAKARRGRPPKDKTEKTESTKSELPPGLPPSNPQEPRNMIADPRTLESPNAPPPVPQVDKQYYKNGCPWCRAKVMVTMQKTLEYRVVRCRTPECSYTGRLYR